MTPLLLGVAIAVIGLAIVEWLAGRRGAGRWPAGRRRAILGAMAALLLVARVGPDLGLRYGTQLLPRLLAAAFALLLGVYLWQLLPRLRPLLGARLPARPPAVFALLPFVVYLALMPWMSAERPPDGDEPYYLLVTHSLAYDFDTDLTDNYAAGDSQRFVPRALEPQQGDPVGPDGELYSRHNALLPLVLGPAYRLAGLHGALAVMCALAALLCWWTLRLARHWYADRPGPVLIAYFVLAFTSPLLLYSHQVWVEIPAALLVTLALDAVWTLERRRSRVQVVLLAGALLLLPLLKIRFVLLVAPLLLLFAWRRAGGKRRLRLLSAGAVGVAALVALILAFNQWRYGNPFKYHDLSKLGFYWNDLSRYPRGMVGLLFDSAFGLFATAPVWLLLFVGRVPGRLLLHGALVSVPYLLALVPRSEWYGAWSPPFRYGCFALSLLTLLLVPAFERRRQAGGRLLLGALTAATGLLTVLWVVRPGWTYNLAHGRSHLLDLASLSQQIDVARFFPSGLRPNLALWIWPPVVLALVWLATRWRRRWRGGFAFGTALPALGIGLALAAAHALPTKVLEVEDPHIQHHGGELYPEQWRTARARFHGGWKLGVGDRLVVPVVPGGRRMAAEVVFRSRGVVDPLLLHVEPVNGSATPLTVDRQPRWQTVVGEPMAWPEGTDRLVLYFEPAGAAARQPTVIIDRVRLHWYDEPAS